MTLWNFGYGAVNLDEIKGVGWQDADNLHQIRTGVVGLDNRLSRYITPPQPVLGIKNNYIQGNTLPAQGTAGDLIALPGTKSADFVKRTATISTIWTVGIAAVPGANWWPAAYADAVDGAIWVLSLEGSTDPTCHLSKINDVTGAITNVGNFSGTGFIENGTSTYYPQFCFMDRPAPGSGDLILHHYGNTLVVSSSTGAIVSGPTPRVNGGIPVRGLNASLNGMEFGGNYRSVDGLIDVTLAPSCLPSSPEPPKFGLMRQGAQITISDQAIIEAGPYARSVGGSHVSQGLMVWYGYVAMGAYTSTGAGSALNQRYFDRTDFDRWLHDVADLYGLSSS